jgi:hypothetical protein
MEAIKPYSDAMILRNANGRETLRWGERVARSNVRWLSRS